MGDAATVNGHAEKAAAPAMLHSEGWQARGARRGVAGEGWQARGGRRGVVRVCCASEALGVSSACR